MSQVGTILTLLLVRLVLGLRRVLVWAVALSLLKRADLLARRWPINSSVLLIDCLLSIWRFPYIVSCPDFASDTLALLSRLLLAIQRAAITIVLRTKNVELLVAAWLMVNFDWCLGQVFFWLLPRSGLILHNLFVPLFRLVGIAVLLSLLLLKLLKVRVGDLLGGNLCSACLDGWRVIPPSDVERALASFYRKWILLRTYLADEKLWCSSLNFPSSCTGP